MKYIQILSCLFISISLISCGDDVEGTTSSEFGNLEGTVWELSVYSVYPGYGHTNEQYWGDTQFIAYADKVGLPYEKIENQVEVCKDTLSREGVSINTLTFSKNVCTWRVDNSESFKINERTTTYECYRFTPQDFTLPNQHYNEYIDTIRITNESIKYRYNEYFVDEWWFNISLTNGVYYSLINSSTQELPDGHIAESQQTTFDNLRVEPTSFIMQKGDEIYSAQYDVTAGWLILNMISPKKEEIGKFEIKKIE